MKNKKINKEILKSKKGEQIKHFVGYLYESDCPNGKTQYLKG